MQSLLRTSTFAELRDILGRPGDATGSTIALREGSPEMNYFVARAELRQPQTPEHGLLHLADLLAVDPARPEWLALLDEYEQRFGSLERLLGSEDGASRYYSTEAVRAYLWARAGRIAEAIDLLVAVTHAKPSVRYLDAWVLPWLERAGGLGALEPVAALQLLTAVLPSFPEAQESSERVLRAARRWAALGVAFVRSGQAAALAPDLTSSAEMLVAGLCRKAGLFAEGLAIADVRRRPSWHTWTARGLLLRRQGQLDEALDAFVQAGRHDPTDTSWMLEAADMFFENRRWPDARRLYERVLAGDPQHAWARPSMLFCRWRERSSARYPDEHFPPELGALAHDRNARANALYDAFRAWRGLVPEPRDATTHTIRQVLEHLAPERATQGGTIRVATTDVEAPSNRVLFHAIYGGAVTLAITYSHVAQPDPRAPHALIAHALWRREGELLVPALAPPPREIARAIAELAAAARPLPEAWGAASRWAATRTRDDAVALLGCVVHPPAIPEPSRTFSWIPEVQLTVALVLANLAIDEPWERSVRRDALLSLLHGPMDWSTEAAIVALARLTRDEPAILTEVHRAFATLLAARPSSGAACWEETLIDQWLDLPGLYPPERDELEQRWRELQERDGG